MSRDPAPRTLANRLFSLAFLAGTLGLASLPSARAQVPAPPAVAASAVPQLDLLKHTPKSPPKDASGSTPPGPAPRGVVAAPAAPEFPHARHAAVPCATCHGAAARATAPGEAGPVPAEVCVACHTDGRRPALRSPAAPWSVHFSHAAHAGRGLDCAHCHPGGARPAEATCLACHHAGEPRADAGPPYRQAPAACATCHLSGPDGRLRTDLPRGQLRPADPRQDHGDPAWLRAAHGDSARAMPASCDGCHKPPDCSGCHLGRGRPLEIHPADYILSHPVDARRDGPRCASCHREQTFCRNCHIQSGVTMGTGPLAFGVATPGRNRFHPAGFAGSQGDVPGPDHHRHAARRSLPTCVGCHAERDCVGCHSSQAAPALRASPHPPGVARRLCDRAVDANPRGCLKCHRDAGELDRLCR